MASTSNSSVAEDLKEVFQNEEIRKWVPKPFEMRERSLFYFVYRGGAGPFARAAYGECGCSV